MHRALFPLLVALGLGVTWMPEEFAPVGIYGGIAAVIVAFVVRRPELIVGGVAAIAVTALINDARTELRIVTSFALLIVLVAGFLHMRRRRRRHRHWW